MIIRNEKKQFGPGYTPVTKMTGEYADWMTDFGILVLSEGESYLNEEGTERAFLLMSGTIQMGWAGEDGPVSIEAGRVNVLEDDPVVLHVPAGTRVELKGLSDRSELAVTAVVNEKQFHPRLWEPGQYRADRFGEGTLQDTSTRLVRTFFDAATAEDSAFVLGEVINFPGKWSSYPPHDHPQREIYHYRFFPEQGWGHAELEDDVYKVKNGDTYAIPPGVTHSQCAAPGYAMYYIWIIPHLPADKFGPDSRNFRNEHAWVMDPKAAIWPDAPLDEVLEGQK